MRVYLRVGLVGIIAGLAGKSVGQVPTPEKSVAQQAVGSEVRADVAQSKAAADVAPLIAAIRQGDVETVRSLLAAGADPNGAGKDGWTGLMSASRRDHLGMVEMLLGYGASVNAKSPDGVTALMAAANEGNTRSVQALLAAGAEPGIADTEGFTAAMRAAAKGYTEVVLLLERSQRLKPERPSDGLATPLHVAALMGRTDTVKALVANGANPNLIDKRLR